MSRLAAVALIILALVLAAIVGYHEYENHLSARFEALASASLSKNVAPKEAHIYLHGARTAVRTKKDREVLATIEECIAQESAMAGNLQTQAYIQATELEPAMRKQEDAMNRVNTYLKRNRLLPKEAFDAQKSATAASATALNHLNQLMKDYNDLQTKKNQACKAARLAVGISE